MLLLLVLAVTGITGVLLVFVDGDVTVAGFGRVGVPVADHSVSGSVLLPLSGEDAVLQEVVLCAFELVLSLSVRCGEQTRPLFPVSNSQPVGAVQRPQFSLTDLSGFSAGERNM
ncbi:hypothetical protein chiPu_0017460 [Chiloscyllium punctatum]|uniref:Secreted protein n=1 Tax=Chiloscyllium punctatum TaxID=137246 RepID=A0A401RG68_CHIPU|nr:hypothetical protein [Chiloscyllium punctatum]